MALGTVFGGQIMCFLISMPHALASVLFATVSLARFGGRTSFRRIA
jgi:hypothetical protein